ncbi:MAG TPA: phenylalanine--tRNA ligase subunit alpha [Rickettsiales bacterium]|nr:phenylalanine--tRNA ligase subunit alpha [Rickettsiales bacterium]
MSDLKDLINTVQIAINSAESSAALEALRVEYLGKKGIFTEQLKTLGALPPEERKARGQALNEAKQQVTTAIEAKAEVLKLSEINARLATEWADVTLAPRPENKGYIHPISRVLEEITAIFAAQGFASAYGPEIEDDYHNFTALNFPENHPARQMHDTFFIDASAYGQTGSDKVLLRTHTSPVQIRTMQAGKPPFRFIAPGKTFRCDSDLTHTPMFHQVEGFCVGKDINMGHLKGCIESFLREFFELDKVPVRFRPSFFPFTEPSAEVDIGCARSRESIKIGAGEDWLEVMGCGMIHPNVLRNCNIDPDEWQGFAFGMGVERLAMLKYGIPDLRTFFESDIRWLRHYGFSPLGDAA